MGDVGEGAEKYKNGGSGINYDEQGGGSDGDTLRELDLDSNGGYAEGAGGVPPSGGPYDSSYFSSVSRIGGMGAVVEFGCGRLPFKNIL